MDSLDPVDPLNGLSHNIELNTKWPPSEDYPTFPPRREAELRVWQLTRDWVGRNRGSQAKFVVLLHLPARFVVFNVIQTGVV